MPNTLRTIFFFGAAALSATSTAATPAAAQSFFCPATIAGLTGIHFAVNECTNGSTGAYSNATLAAQANSSATVSVRCTRSQLVSDIVVMAGTSSDSGSGVSGILFSRIQDSLTTHGCSTWAAN